MLSGIETRTAARLSGYLDLATAEAKLSALNMANVDTPGYRTVGLDFEGEMRAALGQLDSGSAQKAPVVSEVDGLVARPDGNNVSMERESLRLAEAQLKFRTGTTLLRLEQQRMLNAIHAEGK